MDLIEVQCSSIINKVINICFVEYSLKVIFIQNCILFCCWQETELLKRIRDEQTRMCKLSDELKDKAEELSCVRALLDQEKSRHIASQQILQKTVMEMNEVKEKV